MFLAFRGALARLVGRRRRVLVLAPLRRPVRSWVVQTNSGTPCPALASLPAVTSRSAGFAQSPERGPSRRWFGMPGWVNQGAREPMPRRLCGQRSGRTERGGLHAGSSRRPAARARQRRRHPGQVRRDPRGARESGEPPYLVRFDDGHTRLVFPGPDAMVEAKAKKAAGRARARREPGRRAAPRRKKTRRPASSAPVARERGVAGMPQSFGMKSRVIRRAHRRAARPCTTSRRTAPSSHASRRRAATGCCTSSCRTPPPGVALMELGAGSDADLLAALAELLPADDRWRHAHGSRGHGRSHVLPALVAAVPVVPVRGRAGWRWVPGNRSPLST